MDSCQAVGADATGLLLLLRLLLLLWLVVAAQCFHLCLKVCNGLLGLRQFGVEDLDRLGLRSDKVCQLFCILICLFQFLLLIFVLLLLVLQRQTNTFVLPEQVVVQPAELLVAWSIRRGLFGGRLSGGLSGGLYSPFLLLLWRRSFWTGTLPVIATTHTTLVGTMENGMRTAADGTLENALRHFDFLIVQ